MRNPLKTRILLMASFASFLTPFMGSAIHVALPSIASEFSADAVVMNWIATSYLLASALFIVPFGRLSDILGRKRIFFWGITIFTVTSLASAFATSALVLIVIRVLQGLGSSMIYGTGLAMLTAVFDKGERGRAIGINVASVYTGLTLGPVLGGVLTQNLGWRSIFIVLVPVGLLTMYLTKKVRKDWIEAPRQSFDYIGSIIYGVSLTLLLYSFSILPSFTGTMLVLLSLLGFVAFFIYEQRLRYPVLKIQLFRNKAFSLSSLAALINYSATFAVAYLSSLYLQYIKGMSPQ